MVKVADTPLFKLPIVHTPVVELYVPVDVVLET